MKKQQELRNKKLIDTFSICACYLPVYCTAKAALCNQRMLLSIPDINAGDKHS